MLQNQTSPRREARRHRVRCWRRERADSADQGIEHALLKVAICRYGLFVKKFGRDPRPNEPLFFDPHSDLPVEADAVELRRQVMETARSAGVNADMVLRFLSLKAPEETAVRTSPR
jgi:hypothetical protein